MIATCQRGVEVVGVGSNLPERVMTNDEIATMVETSDEWIASRTGIRQRRIAGDGESSAGLGAGRPCARSRAPGSPVPTST